MTDKPNRDCFSLLKQTFAMTAWLNKYCLITWSATTNNEVIIIKH